MALYPLRSILDSIRCAKANSKWRRPLGDISWRCPTSRMSLMAKSIISMSVGSIVAIESPPKFDRPVVAPQRHQVAQPVIFLVQLVAEWAGIKVLAGALALVGFELDNRFAHLQVFGKSHAGVGVDGGCGLSAHDSSSPLSINSAKVWCRDSLSCASI